MGSNQSNYPAEGTEEKQSTARSAQWENQFEDINLWQAVRLLIFRPGATIRALGEILTTPAVAEHPPARRSTPLLKTDTQNLSTSLSESRYFHLPYLWRFCLLLFSLGIIWIGTDIMYGRAINPILRARNAFGSSWWWIGAGALVYLVGTFWLNQVYWLPLWHRWRTGEDPRPMHLSRPLPTFDENLDSSQAPPADRVKSQPWFTHDTHPLDVLLTWFEENWMRLVFVPVAILLTWFAFDKNAVYDEQGRLINIMFTTPGLQSWFGAIALWYIILAIDVNGIVASSRRGEFKPFSSIISWLDEFKWRWPHVVLLGIGGLAAYFRLYDLDSLPPDMTSDHIEKLRDALRVHNGYYAIFFDNNGGREAFQMYLVKIVADWFGVGFNFHALKLTSVIEGILGVLLIFPMAKTMIGRDTPENQRLGDWVGLSAAALLAISSWHVMISRLGLRIPLTPIATMLATIFLVRGVRYNNRLDFINLGFILGAGLYWYQSNRMLPVVAIAVVGMAMLFNRRDLRQVFRYLINLGLAGFFAFVIYLPMHRYAINYPGEFWSRTYGRIYGDNVYGYCQYDTVNNRYVFCGPTTEELIEKLVDERSAILANFEEGFLMFGWEGDPGWFQNGLGYPAMDALTHAFLLLGALMWVIYTFQRRDASLLIVPFGMVLMMFTSVLAIAPGINENPSFTRMSGVLPFAFLLAGFPLGMLAYSLVRAGKRRPVFYLVALGLGVWFVYTAIPANWDNYFGNYRASYERSWKPYKQFAAPLKEFAEGEGSFGNAFVIHRAHWLDHRIVGAMAGDINWPNTINAEGLECQTIFACMLRNQGTPYEYDPTKPLLIMINRTDHEALATYPELFPGGQLQFVEARNGNGFYVYTAPPGANWLAGSLTKQIQGLACMENCRFLR